MTKAFRKWHLTAIKERGEARRFCEWYESSAIMADFRGIYVSQYLHPLTDDNWWKV